MSLVQRAFRPQTPRQRGASLIIALVLLTLLALLVLGSFNLSSSNLVAVGNMQRRDEAAAATVQLIEDAVAVQLKNDATTGLVAPSTDQLVTNGFQVDLEMPRCIEVISTTSGSPVSVGTSVTLGPGFSASVSYDTLWEFKSTATDTSGLGTKVVTVQGVRVILTEDQKNQYCP